MDKAILYCSKCDKKYTVEFEFISDLVYKCPKCKNEDIWIKNFEWEKPKEVEIELGKGKCGTVWR